MTHYYVIAERGNGRTWWLSFPDGPGIFSAADDAAEIPAQARDALETVLMQPSGPSVPALGDDVVVRHDFLLSLRRPRPTDGAVDRSQQSGLQVAAVVGHDHHAAVSDELHMRPPARSLCPALAPQPVHDLTRRHATGARRGLNTRRSLATVTALGCHDL